MKSALVQNYQVISVVPLMIHTCPVQAVVGFRWVFIAAMVMFASPRKTMKTKFTAEQIEAMRELHRGGKTYKQIGAQFNCSRETVSHRLNGTKWRAGPRRPMERAIIHRATLDEANRVVIPAAALAEREYRQSLAPKDYTAAFMGDPLPGYSALDRRLA